MTEICERGLFSQEHEPFGLDKIRDLDDPENVMRLVVAAKPELGEVLVGMGFHGHDKDGKEIKGNGTFSDLGEKLLLEIERLISQESVAQIDWEAEQATKQVYAKHDSWYLEPTGEHNDKGLPMARIVTTNDRRDFINHEFYFDAHEDTTEFCCITEQLVRNLPMTVKYAIENIHQRAVGQNISDFIAQRIQKLQSDIEIGREMESMGMVDSEIADRTTEALRETAAVIIESQRIMMRDHEKIAA